MRLDDEQGRITDRLKDQLHESTVSKAIMAVCERHTSLIEQLKEARERLCIAELERDTLRDLI